MGDYEWAMGAVLVALSGPGEPSPRPRGVKFTSLGGGYFAAINIKTCF